MKKTFPIVMLPTEKESKLILIDDGINEEGLHYNNYTTKKFNSEGYNFTILPQHLYIISDDVIKEGDWIYNKLDAKPIQYSKKALHGDNMMNPKEYGYKKIVATTDKSLRVIKDWNNNTKLFMESIGDNSKDFINLKELRQIPESFIQAYIKDYNEGKPITEIDLEMVDNGEEGWSGSDADGEPIWIEKWEIKTRPDNTVIVHKSKMYTRDEVINLICNMPFDIDLFYGEGSLNKWIQDNL